LGGNAAGPQGYPQTPEICTMSEPWDQLPEEPADAYAAFLFYLRQGLGRRMLDAYNDFRRARGEKLVPRGKSACGTWYKWRHLYCWPERAAAHDRAKLEDHATNCAMRVLGMLQLMAEEGIAAIREERDLRSPWKNWLKLLHALAKLVTPGDEPQPLRAARTYNGAAPPLPDRPGSLCPSNPGRPFAPGIASDSPH
jgi:hypothetical protein